MALSPWKKLANKVAKAACVRKERDDLTPAEKIAGAEIVQKLQNFYDLTDTQIKTSNFFTRFLVWIREFGSSRVSWPVF